MNNNVDAIYSEVDDFCQTALPLWTNWLKEQHIKKRIRPSIMSYSEVITLLILFHLSHYRDFKNFYLYHVIPHLHAEFPHLVSYSQMVRLAHCAMPLLSIFLSRRLGKPTGIAFIDSTRLAVCHNRRIPRHRVFSGIAKRGKTTMGWFYGFKLHLIINDKAEIIAVKLSRGDVDDRAPVSELTRNLSGTLYGDKGYLSCELKEHLALRGLRLITNVRRNMKKPEISLWDKMMLRKRFLIETVNAMLKEVCHIEHTRHRHPVGFLVNLFSGLIAYSFLELKPKSHIIRL